jgi:hypothetical protein
MEIKIEKFEPTFPDVVMEQCGGELCGGNPNPTCETCGETRMPGQQPAQAPAANPQDLVTAV